MRLAKSWKDVSIRRADMLRDLDSVEDDNMRLYELVKTLNLDDDEVTIGKLFGNINDLSFYKEEIKPEKVEKELIINGKEYEVVTKIGDLTFSQYVDIRNYGEMNEDNQMLLMLSAVIIPKGEKYGRYDMEKVKKDIYEHLDIVTGSSILANISNIIKAYMRMFPNIYSVFEEENEEKNDDIKKETEEKELKNTGFMGLWWSFVMMEKVIKYTNSDYFTVSDMNLVEFSNIYSYVLDRERLEEKIKNESLKKYKKR